MGKKLALGIAALVAAGSLWLLAGAIPSVRAEADEPDAEAIYNRFCLQCHGLRGDGHGPARPYVWPTPRDFTSGAFKYKTTPAGQLPSDEDLAVTIRHGVSGTSMHGFRVSLDDKDVAALVAKVKSFVKTPAAAGPPASAEPNKAVNLAVLPDKAIAEDRRSRVTKAGYWVANGLEDEKGLFGGSIKLQGPPPEEFAPAQATQSANQCARCHDKQWSEWGGGSFHAQAGSPGLVAQLVAMEFKGHGASAESCQRCHAPLAEQHPLVRAAQGYKAAGPKGYAKNPAFDAELRKEGVNCATCHMRGWRRFGPPNPSQTLLRMPNYPVREVEKLYTYLEIYERSDFCMPCHQLQPRLALNGKPLLNTYKEWLEGPYMRRGIQCQHCHMPNREHKWKGVHDPDTFRQGVRLETLAARKDGVVTARARVTNVGAGHYLPTTPTPAAWLSVELVDSSGRPVLGARDKMRIGRKIAFDGAWKEVEDTRIPPGESVELARGWKDGRTSKATHVRVRLRVHPDDYYEGLYTRRLKAKLSSEQRSMFLEALKAARASHYTALERLVPIEKR